MVFLFSLSLIIKHTRRNIINIELARYLSHPIGRKIVYIWRKIRRSVLKSTLVTKILSMWVILEVSVWSSPLWPWTSILRWMNISLWHAEVLWSSVLRCWWIILIISPKLIRRWKIALKISLLVLVIILLR